MQDVYKRNEVVSTQNNMPDVGESTQQNKVLTLNLEALRTWLYRHNEGFNAHSKRTPLLYPMFLWRLKGSLWYYLNHSQSFLKGGPVKIFRHQISFVFSGFNVDQFTLATSLWGGLVECLVNHANGGPMRPWQTPH